MTKKHEELVEELAQEMAFCYNEEGRLVRDREKARFYIARIGKAYAEGLELPGEEWRGPAEDMDSVALLTYDGIIIGLRKEERGK